MLFSKVCVRPRLLLHVRSPGCCRHLQCRTELTWIAELLPWLETAKQSEGRKEAQSGRKGKKPAEKNGEGSKVKTLDHFVGKSRAGKATAGDSDDGEDDEDLLAGNLIEHPDGTLSLGGPADAPP